MVAAIDKKGDVAAVTLTSETGEKAVLEVASDSLKVDGPG